MGRKACVAVGMLVVAQVAVAQANLQESKLAGSGRWWATDDYDYYVYSVAISADGLTAVVGGAGDGAARVYSRSSLGWSRQVDIPVGTDAVWAGPGYSVAISADGTTAIVGELQDNADIGAAWVFTRGNGGWSQQGPKLVGNDAVGLARQGLSVAISADGNTAIVGGPADYGGRGAAWVFVRSDGVWSQQGSKLVGTDYAQAAGQGSSVAISADGNTAIVGCPWDNSGNGAAWVFARNGGVWSQQGPKFVGSGAVGNAYQGHSVALSSDGNVAIVGGPGDSGTGAAWVYTRSRGTWSQQGPKLVGAGGAGRTGQGYSVAISADGGTAIIGGPWDDSDSGATWVFTRSGSVWSQKGGKLVGTGASVHAYQGASVAISANGETILVGGPGDADDGAAWVFSAPLSPLRVPVAAHTDGFNGSRWRSDLGLLNPGTAAANVEIRFFASGGVVSSTISVPAGTQSILTDVVGQLDASGQGALEIVSDQQLKVTARTYNQAASDAGCSPGGTQGQEYPVLSAGSGLSAGQTAYLPGLIQNADYRTNIGLVSTDEGIATVLVELFDGAGTRLAEYTLELAHGQWAQADRPFEASAGQTAMDRGYARITVQSGSGVHAFASVIDNVTHDPTTVAMQR